MKIELNTNILSHIFFILAALTILFLTFSVHLYLGLFFLALFLAIAGIVLQFRI